MVDEQLNELDCAVFAEDSATERRVTPLVLRVDMGAGFEECFCGAVVLVDAGHVQWGEAVGVGLVDVEALVEHLLDAVRAAPDGRLMQGVRAITTLLVHLGL